VDCEDIADLRTDAARASLGVALSDLACAWGDALIAGREPESWRVVRHLLRDGVAGILVPSFANGATTDDQNLVLWRWGAALPQRAAGYDPTGKLPTARP
jgi:RES domain-containing protein